MIAEKYNIELPLYNLNIDVYMSHCSGYARKQIEEDYPGLKTSITRNTAAWSGRASHKKVGISFILMVVLDIETGFDDIDSTIVHECLHISYYICESLGIGLTPDNHEAQAYILECVYKNTIQAKEDFIKLKGW